MYHIIKQTNLGSITSIATSLNKDELLQTLDNVLGANYEELPGNVFLNSDTGIKYKIAEELEYFMLLKRTDAVL